MLLQLLPEINKKIFNHCDSTSLRNLSCCCTRLTTTSRSSLWHTIKIPFKDLVSIDLRRDRRLIHLKYTKVIHLLAPDVVLEKSLKNCLSINICDILRSCNPVVLYTSFLPCVSWAAIKKFTRLCKLDVKHPRTWKVLMNSVPTDITGYHQASEDILFNIFNLSTLKEVSLQRCSNVGMKHLQSMSKLKKISMFDCHVLSDEKVWQNVNLQAPTHIDFHSTEISDTAVQKISFLENLQSLNLSKCGGISNEALLFISSRLSLTSLDISWCYQITDSGISYIKTLSNMMHLTLSGCQIKDTSLLYLSLLKSLTHLDMSNCISITDLSFLDHLPNLSTLYLNMCSNISDSSLSCVGKLYSLKELDISFIGFSNVGLLSLHNLLKLEHLNIKGCENVRDLGISCVDKMTCLKSLDLCFTNITDVGVHHIFKATQLEIINLSSCKQITDESLIHYSSLGHLKKLSLYGCSKITDKAFNLLKNASVLEFLDVSFCGDKVTALGYAEIAEFTKLKELYLDRCGNLDDTVLKAFQNLTSLCKLSLAKCYKVSDIGIFYLSSLMLLKELNIRYCINITDRGFAALLNLKSLEMVYVKGCFKIREEMLRDNPICISWGVLDSKVVRN